jgi:CBS domain-containing protein
MSIPKLADLPSSELLIPVENIPIAQTETLLIDAFDAIDSKGIGTLCIIDHSFGLRGVLTDGDIRRMLLKVQKPLAAMLVDDVINFATTNPISISHNTPIIHAASLMAEKRIWDLPVLSDDLRLIGLLHLHPVVSYILDLEA